MSIWHDRLHQTFLAAAPDDRGTGGVGHVDGSDVPLVQAQLANGFGP